MWSTNEIQDLSSNILGKANNCMIKFCLGYCDGLDGKMSVWLSEPNFCQVRPENKELHLNIVCYTNWRRKKNSISVEFRVFPPEVFLWKVERAISRFSGPLHHHVISPSQPHSLPWALLAAEFVFVCYDASKPPLAPLYSGPYKVLKNWEKFFVLQVRDKSDSVSEDMLKPAIFSIPVTPAVPQLRGWPWLVPASVTMPPVPVWLQMKMVQFLTRVPAMQLHWNPWRKVQGSLPLSAFLRPHLLGGVSVASTTTYPQPPYYRSVLQNLLRQGSYQSELSLCISFPV